MKMLKAYAPIIGVFCLALLVRIAYNVTVARHYHAIFDAALYYSLAKNLVDEHCYCLYPHLANVSRPPLWPFVMAVLFSVLGKQEYYAQLFYCFLGSGTCVLIYLFARDLFGSRAALLTGILAAIYTGLFIWDGWLYSESLYSFCLLVCVYSLYRLQQTPYSAEAPAPGEKKFSLFFRRLHPRLARRGWVIMCGIFLALAALTRPNGILLLGLVYLWGLLVIRASIIPWKIVVRDALIITGITFLIIAPWTYRNYSVAHTFILASTGTGEALNGAYNDQLVCCDPTVRGMWKPPKGAVNHDKLNYTPANDRADTQRAFNWMRTHPRETLYLLGLHFINTWIPYTYSHGLPMEEYPYRIYSKILKDLIYIMTSVVFCFAAFGLFITWKHWKRQLMVVYLVIALALAQNVAFYGDMRFRSPIEPSLVLLAGGTLWYLSGTSFSALRATLKKRFAHGRALHEVQE